MENILSTILDNRIRELKSQYNNLQKSNNYNTASNIEPLINELENLRLTFLKEETKNLRKAKCCGTIRPLKELAKNRNGFCKRCNNKFYLKNLNNSFFIMGKDHYEHIPSWGFSSFFNKNFKSIDGFKSFYCLNANKGYQIVDDYDKIYTWDEFKEEWDFHCTVFGF